MAKAILKTDQTSTADTDILGKDWYGEYNLVCSVYDSADAHVQFRVPGGTWINARYNGSEIKLTAAGENVDVKLVRDFDYRISTETAGAEVWIAKHDPHGS